MVLQAGPQSLFAVALTPTNLWPGDPSPATQTVPLPASCLSVSSSLSSIRLIHPEPPKHSSQLSPNEVRTQWSLSLCQTFPVSRRRSLDSGGGLLSVLWAISLHMWPSTFKIAFLLSSRPPSHFVQYLNVLHSLLHGSGCHRQ